MMLLPSFNSHAKALLETTQHDENEPYISLNEKFFSIIAWDNWINLTKQLPVCHDKKGPWIAGGAVRHFLLDELSPGSDIDYFCYDLEQHRILCSRLEMKDAVKTLDTIHHTTYTIGEENPLLIQVIKARYCKSLTEHLNQFDFTICQTGWDGTKIIISLDAYKDLLKKELNCTGVFHSPVGSLVRLAKYYKQGFTPRYDTMMTLLKAAKDIDTNGAYSK